MRHAIGVDLVHVPSFREQLADPASTFAHGTFTPQERRDAEDRPDRDPARHLAARFAAKEALIKAFDGLRFGAPPLAVRVDLREIEVVSDPWGRPALRLHGDVAALVGDASLQVSLSHDGDHAIAVVLLCLPLPSQDTAGS